ncbi:MAG: WYL domain-containing protein [Muribaculaceae bacterium]|nr:WYL domain-containing protein [Muribaculaceae bacterium]
MTQYNKYIWLIDTIRRTGKISFKELSKRWEENKNISDYHPLHRGTFNRWRDSIEKLFGIKIECRKADGFVYYIKNLEDIEEDKLKQWMYDTLSLGNLISENLYLKDRILVSEVISGHNHLQELLKAMKENLKVKILYKSFKTNEKSKLLMEPYSVKLFDNRWYVMGKTSEGDLQVFGLDRVVTLEISQDTYKLPKNFDASEYFSNYYGIVVDESVKPQKIILQANKQSKEYIKSLPLHHSQKLIEESEDYADFELYLAPTYDFVMKLLQHGAMIEVLKPESLRQTLKGWIKDLQELYEN